jgi:hypothetical protein
MRVHGLGGLLTQLLALSHEDFLYQPEVAACKAGKTPTQLQRKRELARLFTINGI